MCLEQLIGQLDSLATDLDFCLAASNFANAIGRVDHDAATLPSTASRPPMPCAAEMVEAVISPTFPQASVSDLVTSRLSVDALALIVDSCHSNASTRKFNHSSQSLARAELGAFAHEFPLLFRRLLRLIESVTGNRQNISQPSGLSSQSVIDSLIAKFVTLLEGTRGLSMDQCKSNSSACSDNGDWADNGDMDLELRAAIANEALVESMFFAVTTSSCVRVPYWN
jgi:hypothetical protein